MRFKKSIAGLILVLLAPYACNAKTKANKRCKPVVVAVVDTGFGYKDHGHEARLCKYGHRDFTIDRQFSSNYGTHDLVPTDFNGHGTNVAGIIDNYSKLVDIDYCLVIIKYHSKAQTPRQNVLSDVEAIRYAANIHADYINFSSNGEMQMYTEEEAIKTFLDQGGTFVTVAGNEGVDLDLPYNKSYPAMYDKRIVVVGNINPDGSKEAESNYGQIVNRWEVGDDITAYGITLSGTSMSAATATGKLVAETRKTCFSR